MNAVETQPCCRQPLHPCCLCSAVLIRCTCFGPCKFCLEQSWVMCIISDINELRCGALFNFCTPCYLRHFSSGMTERPLGMCHTPHIEQSCADELNFQRPVFEAGRSDHNLLLRRFKARRQPHSRATTPITLPKSRYLPRTTRVHGRPHKHTLHTCRLAVKNTMEPDEARVYHRSRASA